MHVLFQTSFVLLVRYGNFFPTLNSRAKATLKIISQLAPPRMYCIYMEELRTAVYQLESMRFPIHERWKTQTCIKYFQVAVFFRGRRAENRLSCVLEETAQHNKNGTTRPIDTAGLKNPRHSEAARVTTSVSVYQPNSHHLQLEFHLQCR